MKTRSSEFNLSFPNQMYSCHNNWNWSNKSLSSQRTGSISYSPYLLFFFVKSLPDCYARLTSLCDYLFRLASYYLPSRSYYLAAISHHALVSYLSTYGLSSIVHLPLRVYRSCFHVCLRNFHVLKTFIKIAYSPPL